MSGWAAGPCFAGGAEHTIKFSTLAPEGSAWMKEMRLLANEIKKATDGKVAFKFYPGGVSGDEIDVIRKIRIGQLHAAGFTGVGLGEILPQVRVLDLPFLFETDEQIQHVYEKMNPYFAAEFEKKGYVLLGWVPVGWIYFFSQSEVQTVDDLKKTKPWMWEGDPLVRETYQAMGIQPVPLSVTDVLLSLQTGLVNTVYASSQAALALQWFTKVNYMTQLRMGYATGGVLISKKKFDKLPQEYQETIKRISAWHLKKLVLKVQKDNDRSIQVMMKNGVKRAALPGNGEIEKFRRAGSVARNHLVGNLFSKELLDRVISHMKEAR
ncbi:MAG: TRAP transporter substrate-binding protein DctP [Nitrospinaceae bacterium]